MLEREARVEILSSHGFSGWELSACGSLEFFVGGDFGFSAGGELELLVGGWLKLLAVSGSELSLGGDLEFLELFAGKGLELSASCRLELLAG